MNNKNRQNNKNIGTALTSAILEHLRLYFLSYIFAAGVLFAAAGLILSLTGVGAIVGIPLAALGLKLSLTGSTATIVYTALSALYALTFTSLAVAATAAVTSIIHKIAKSEAAEKITSFFKNIANKINPTSSKTEQNSSEKAPTKSLVSKGINNVVSFFKNLINKKTPADTAVLVSTPKRDEETVTPVSTSKQDEEQAKTKSSYGVIGTKIMTTIEFKLKAKDYARLEEVYAKITDKFEATYEIAPNTTAVAINVMRDANNDPTEQVLEILRDNFKQNEIEFAVPETNHNQNNLPRNIQ